ncbi:hypothetical protein [Silvibacterium dinghuense]|uniref:Uncharacterized protein n=1 Tax=Silvibacterium dinghuense TaxID=1560006 RepID=A0A4Q1SHN8_9BACT|nr:hypothetical protein [Silvibacterium dinghuense]RXS97076.1 hypothetical protein ESZ00_03885 [Silvibacterium dinghuense]
MMAKAVHLWELRPTANGGTVVIVQESLEGPLVARFVSSSQLTNTDLAWLKALKTRAESHP